MFSEAESAACRRLVAWALEEDLGEAGDVTSKAVVPADRQGRAAVPPRTRQYGDAVAGLPCRVLDTRKTTPGWRLLEKYAVRCGGGHNHRMGLYDGVLIKDNHLAALRTPTSIADAVRAARAQIDRL